MQTNVYQICLLAQWCLKLWPTHSTSGRKFSSSFSGYHPEPSVWWHTIYWDPEHNFSSLHAQLRKFNKHLTNSYQLGQKGAVRAYLDSGAPRQDQPCLNSSLLLHMIMIPPIHQTICSLNYSTAINLFLMSILKSNAAEFEILKKKKKKQWSEKCRALALRLSRGGRAMATGGGQLTDTSACHSHKEQMCINKHLCNHFTRVPLSFVSNLRDFFLQCKDFSSSHKISELLNNSPGFRSHCCSIPQLPIAVCTRGYANKQET